MAVQVSQSAPSLLRTTLRADGILSFVIGLFGVVDASALAEFSGLDMPLAFGILGALLAAFGLFQIWAARTPQLERRAGWISVALCDAWTLASIVLLAVDWNTLTNGGRWLIGGLALVAFDFGLAHWYALRKR